MAKTTTKLIIEVNESIHMQATAVQMDNNSRYLDVCLYDGGVPIDLTGHVVRINVKRVKSASQTEFLQGEITDAAAGRCQFKLSASMLKKVGVLDAQISIWNNDAEILSTKIFKILVTESLRNDEEVEASNEFGVLVVLFTEIQNALELMQHIADVFGEPGEMAAIYGVNTFWGMLEHLAVGADVKQALKENVNSTMDAEGFAPLDQLLLGKIREIWGETHIFDKPGTYTLELPEHVTKITVTACGAGGGGATGYCASWDTTGYYKNGSAGGATSISGLLTLPGGKGGTANTGAAGSAGGEGGGAGGAGAAGPSTSSNSNDRAKGATGGRGLVGYGGSGVTVSSDGTAREGSGGGGGGSLGAGGTGSAGIGTSGTVAGAGAKGGGGGGAGYYGTSSYVGQGGGGGGGGAAVSGYIANIGENRTLTIIVGEGGSGGDNTAGVGTWTNGISIGGKGGDGYVEISWGV